MDSKLCRLSAEAVVRLCPGTPRYILLVYSTCILVREAHLTASVFLLIKNKVPVYSTSILLVY